MAGAEQKKHYEGLNGLRTISCIAIIIMHICANVDYSISGFFYTQVIDSWKWLVYLFMTISSFGLCCGYLERFSGGSIDLGSFYKRRYAKILPFFALLIVMDLVLEPSLGSFSEALLELTLMHGLLPNNAPNVIGVGWFLGTVFLFYMLFPFFTVLVRNKRSAWLTLLAATGINIVCAFYYYRDENMMPGFIASHNFLYCSPFFALGGVLYHYKDTVAARIQRVRLPMLAVCVILTIAYYMIPDSAGSVSIVPYKAMILFTAWIVYAISFDSKILDNRVTRFVSAISLELYLAQMVVFRVIEKLRLLHLFKNEWLCLLAVIVIELLLLVSFVYKRFNAKVLSIDNEENEARLPNYYYLFRNNLINADAYDGKKRALKNALRYYRKSLRILFDPKVRFRAKKSKMIRKGIWCYLLKKYDHRAFLNRLDYYK